MIVYASSVKADVKTSVIKMIDSSLPRKKEAVQKETTVVIEKERKLPLFYERKIRGKKFDLF
ncbi:MAG TPA: hypothetical protein VE933_11270 [Chitinophagaceae bacterium]|nr:hypothetical protein [Chitinophagaceae bacterium]